MQHSPQDIKTRLDKAVDPEGNVLDMVAVLELVTTLERLPLTREALETTRIGKTINLLRKKTNNDDLAKRAKKLVKKWQKLVINQLEASRSIDSPLNGSRISSPQINGTIRDSKSSSIIDRTLKGKKGVKRKRSTSSLTNSPLTLSQDSPSTPGDNSSPSSPFTIEQTKQSTPPNECKKPKLLGECHGKNGGPLQHEEQSPTSKYDGKNDKTHISSDKDVHKNINTTQETISGGENSTSQEINLSQDSFCTDSGIGSIESSVNTYSSQLTPEQEIESSNCIQSNVQQQFEMECKDSNHIKTLLVKNGTNAPNVEEPSTSADTRLKENEKSPKPQLTNQSTEESGISVTESEVLENVDKNEDLESEEMADEQSEPKELILDLNQEANGVNGRFNDLGMWYSWTEVMPYNEGNLHILPYVILD